MNWTRISKRNDGFSVYYSNTTLFKQRYTQSTPSSYVYKYTSDINSISVKGGGSGYGPTDDIPNKAFGGNVRDNDYDALEMVDKSGDIEIYAFKDITGGSAWVVNAFGTTENNNLICLHSGLATDSTQVCMLNTDKSANTIDLMTFVSQVQGFNNAYGTDYIVQPLYAYDEKTGFYTVSGNTELSVFTVIQVQLKKFLVIGKGICVEIE